jgi:hypothetical protein
VILRPCGLHNKSGGACIPDGQGARVHRPDDLGLGPIVHAIASAVAFDASPAEVRGQFPEAAEYDGLDPLLYRLLPDLVF